MKQLVCALAIASLVAGADPAIASWINWPHENQIISTASGTQDAVAMAADALGGLYVVWRSANAYEPGLVMQRIDPEGHPQWVPGGIPLGSRSSTMGPPTVVADGSGGAIVFYLDETSGLRLLVAQRIDGAGAKLWGDGVLVCPGATDVADLQVITDGSGGAFAVWREAREAYLSQDVFLQRVLANGSRAFAAGGVRVATGFKYQEQPQLCGDGAGGCFVVWRELMAGSYPHAIAVQRVSGVGAFLWGAEPVLVATSALELSHPVLAYDDPGGAVIAWEDRRNGAKPEVYAQRISLSGTIAWTPGGVKVAETPNSQNDPVIVSDGQGGAVIGWREVFSAFPGSSDWSSDLLAQSISATGGSRWGASGVALSVSPRRQTGLRVRCDSYGGAYFLWTDERSGEGQDLYAQHLGETGAVHPGWTAGGVAVSTASGRQDAAVLERDGQDGIFAAWEDWRSGAPSIAVQRVFEDGSLGRSTSPSIDSITDVHGDQGGWLRVRFSKSPLDRDGASDPIVSYAVWARLATTQEQRVQSLSTGATVSQYSSGVPTPNPHHSDPRFDQTRWELVASIPAVLHDEYIVRVPTVVDSTEDSVGWSSFIVTAHAGQPHVWFESTPDSGYSVDNLSPPAPTSFVARYEGTDVTLHWLPSRAADFAEFRVHRGGSLSFVPGPSNLIFAGRDTGLVDRAGLGGFYKLAAVDVHGNVGRFAMVSPTSPTATLASFVSSDWTGSAASLVWYGAGLTGLRANIYRSDDGTSWNVLGQVAADEEGFVRFADATVMPRHSYSYRLGILDEDTEQFAGMTTIEIPGGHLTIRSVVGNPVRGEAIHFVASLAGASPARARVLDLAGRVVREQNLQADLSGQLSLSLSGGERLRPGVYLLEVHQAGERAVTRFVYLR